MPLTNYKAQVMRCVLIREMVDVTADDLATAEQLAIKQVQQSPGNFSNSQIVSTVVECFYTFNQSQIFNTDASCPPVRPIKHECELEDWRDEFSYCLLSARLNAHRGRVIMTDGFAFLDHDYKACITDDWLAQIGAINAKAYLAERSLY